MIRIRVLKKKKIRNHSSLVDREVARGKEERMRREEEREGRRKKVREREDQRVRQQFFFFFSRSQRPERTHVPLYSFKLISVT